LELDQLLQNSSFNPATKTIEVYLPPLSIIAVESHAVRLQSNTEYSGWGRYAWSDSGAAKELELSLLRTDWAAETRAKVNPNADHLRKGAANEAARFLKTLIDPIRPGLSIEVRQ
jgi:hypothetical protein